MENILHLRVCPFPKQETSAFVSLYWLLIGVGPRVGGGASGGCILCPRSPKEENHMQRSFTARHTGTGGWGGNASKGSSGALYRLPTIYIYLHMPGHLMSLTTTEVNNYSLFNVKNGGLWQ